MQIKKFYDFLKRGLFRDPLYKNSIFIVLNSALNGSIGFLFWLITAKLYTAQEVGIATALISAISLIVLLSKMGLDISLVRFFPTGDKDKIFSTSLIITTIVAIMIGVFFIIKIKIFIPQMDETNEWWAYILILIFLISNSINLMVGICFVAIRRSEYFSLQSLITGIRIIFIYFLTDIGYMGIIAAVCFSYLMTGIILLYILIKLGINLTANLNRNFLKESFSFSMSNYVAGLFAAIPNYALPIISLNLLGGTDTAYYFISYTIASFLYTIPNAVGTAQFVEGSHGMELMKTAIRSLIAVICFIIPTIALLIILEEWILELIGADYANNCIPLLNYMIMTSIFISLNTIYLSMKRIKNDLKELIFISGLISALLVSFSYMLAKEFGLIGLGYAWLYSNLLGSIVISISILYMKIKNRRN